MVALPTAQRAWTKGVGRSAQRALLIRAGAGRRREYDASSQTARALAALLRREPSLWDVALQATFEHYDERRRGLADEDLVALSRDPAAYLEAHPGCPGELVVAVAYALGAADDERLARLAEVAAARLEARAGAPQADQDAERHRIQGLEDLAEALAKDLKDRERRLRTAEAEAHRLQDALAELQSPARHAGDELAAARAKSADDAQAIAVLEGELAAARTDRERLADAEARAS